MVHASEFGIGADYTIKLEGEEKNLYKNGVKCEPSTPPLSVISDINQSRGTTTTTRLGENISENYGLFMGPDHSFQFYKRVKYVSSSDDDDEEVAVNSTQLAKRNGFRCTNKGVGAPKTCGNNVKSGNPINSAHNCPGKG
ncbi:hypothetical protein LTR08_000361 [Meristemomyces frigidus]|nr:hypothetical protein LTR08_000361 [Meristemomyces frigidus]